jgi:hypothetical protein
MKLGSDGAEARSTYKEEATAPSSKTSPPNFASSSSEPIKPK